jgi:hypothetical protein
MFFKIWAFQNLNNPIKEGPKNPVNGHNLDGITMSELPC